jgi:ADP-ribose pyrophosphatase YjhB (NUDIX family)
MDNLYHVSPVACVEAVVMRAGKILLIQRSDDHLWAVPGGVAEVGETLAQAAERELWEEAGMRGQAVRLLGIFDSRRWKNRSKVHLVSALFLIESQDTPVLHATGEDSHAPTHETLAVDFFAEDKLPELSQGHHLRVPAIFKMLRGEIETPYFDR